MNADRPRTAPPRAIAVPVVDPVVDPTDDGADALAETALVARYLALFDRWSGGFDLGDAAHLTALRDRIQRAVDSTPLTRLRLAVRGMRSSTGALPADRLGAANALVDAYLAERGRDGGRGFLVRTNRD